jgi:hypothetical protein
MKPLLTDVYQTLTEASRAEFAQIARAEFGNGLSATVEGAARALRQWTVKPTSSISPVRQQRRLRFLATLDNFTARLEAVRNIAA